jgi:chemotaxis protein MotA
MVTVCQDTQFYLIGGPTMKTQATSKYSLKQQEQSLHSDIFGAVDAFRGRSLITNDAPSSGSLSVGLIAASLVIVTALISSSNPGQFINSEGLLIVFGGTIASTLIQFSISDLRRAFASLHNSCAQAICPPHERIETMLELSQRVKQNGLLTLEDQASGESDRFFRLGLMLVVDGRSTDDIKRILINEIESSRQLSMRSVQVWETMGNFAPAMGLIGTLLGLIQMLGSLGNGASLGASMAMALVSTLYGSVGANLFFFPIAGKLRGDAEERERCKLITLEGVLSFACLENPAMLEQRFESFSRV